MYSKQYLKQQTFDNQILKSEFEVYNSIEVIVTLKRITDKSLVMLECTFVRQKSEHNATKPEALCCDGRATSSSSS
jgi:hypothetical protein